MLYCHDALLYCVDDRYNEDYELESPMPSWLWSFCCTLFPVILAGKDNPVFAMQQRERYYNRRWERWRWSFIILWGGLILMQWLFALALYGLRELKWALFVFPAYVIALILLLNYSRPHVRRLAGLADYLRRSWMAGRLQQLALSPMSGFELIYGFCMPVMLNEIKVWLALTAGAEISLIVLPLLRDSSLAYLSPELMLNCLLAPAVLGLLWIQVRMLMQLMTIKQQMECMGMRLQPRLWNAVMHLVLQILLYAFIVAPVLFWGGLAVQEYRDLLHGLDAGGMERGQGVFILLYSFFILWQLWRLMSSILRMAPEWVDARFREGLRRLAEEG
ncbi:hypothetical protein JXA32_14880 [Candidatus Sumerlaeota bacterium]|nr:hypothetical protein [Candidatus Sumerlaeota bacterium]